MPVRLVVNVTMPTVGIMPSDDVAEIVQPPAPPLPVVPEPPAVPVVPPRLAAPVVPAVPLVPAMPVVPAAPVAPAVAFVPPAPAGPVSVEPAHAPSAKRASKDKTLTKELLIGGTSKKAGAEFRPPLGPLSAVR